MAWWIIRGLARCRRGDIGRLGPLRQHAVELHCAALPGSSQAVAQREFQLRSVERTFAGVDLRGEAAAPRGIAELRLRPVPCRVVAGAHRRPRRQRHLVVGKTELAIDLAQQGDEARDFALYVLLAAEHMRVVLLEGARPHDAVERTGRLIAMASAELGIADRKLPPRAQP